MLVILSRFLKESLFIVELSTGNLCVVTKPFAVELPEANAPGVLEFMRQPAGDEIAGEHEEHRDADEAARQPFDVRMVDENGDDGEHAQTIEAVDAGALRRRL